MLIQTDVMKIRFRHVIKEIRIRSKSTHNGHPWPLVIRQAVKVIVPDLVITVRVEAVLAGVPQARKPVGGFIEKFDTIQGLSSDGTFHDPLFHQS